jgi:hypothetical protein
MEKKEKYLESDGPQGMDQSYTPLPDFVGVFINKREQMIWFQQGALSRHRLIPDNFAEIYAEAEANDGSEKKKTCPECNMVLHFHKHALAPHVKVGECYCCAGTLMHYSELKEICANPMTEVQREAYLKQLAHSVEGFTQAENLRVSRNGMSGFAKNWQKYRLWAKTKD